ncbi:hypothetical protein [Phycicoccus avicenniae]|uniref:hypothetical protein n=1 Tax=Phycicoccus avicenniae TaxID=2828860 RepID=UPI003D26D418
MGVQSLGLGAPEGAAEEAAVDTATRGAEGVSLLHATSSDPTAAHERVTASARDEDTVAPGLNATG